MKTLKPLLFILVIVTIAFSCKKDSKKTNNDYLIDKYWIQTGLTVDPPILIGGTSITDVWSQVPTCQQDDLQKFSNGGVYTSDEGASKCSPNDPQTTTGTWSFNSDQTILSITKNNQTVSYTIVELTGSTAKLKYSAVQNQIMYTYTITAVPK